MLTRIDRNYQDGSGFNALAFEVKHAQDYEKSQQQYTEYDLDWNSRLYRVWDGMVLIGTFYLKNKKWLANPYFKNHSCVGSGCCYERRFRSNESAINYIIRSYEGR